MLDILFVNVAERVQAHGFHPAPLPTPASCALCGQPYRFWEQEAGVDEILSTRWIVACPDCQVATGRGVKMVAPASATPPTPYDPCKTELENALQKMAADAARPEIREWVDRRRAHFGLPLLANHEE